VLYLKLNYKGIYEQVVYCLISAISQNILTMWFCKLEDPTAYINICVEMYMYAYENN